MNDAAVDIGETTGSISAKNNKLVDFIQKTPGFLEKKTLNKFSEEMTNFVSARVMHKIVDEAVTQGVMSERSKWAYINTFVNRVRGTYIASQRPIMFQGPIGMSMGLFQTYQMNLMQQLFRFASAQGQGASALYMMGLQGSLYGANGLPGFNALNAHVIGTMAGNEENRDITSAAYGSFGTKGGDWLMYGMAANLPSLFGSDDLATNIFTRGDLNPRHLTVVPISPTEAPWVQGWTKFFSNIYNTGAKLANGADVYSTIARGIEHNGISRPLSGLGKLLESASNENGMVYSTTNSGKLLAAHDLVSVASVVNLIGGKTMTEARALDRLYKQKAYDADKSGDQAFLKSVIMTHAAGKDSIPPELYEQFLEKYVANGGDITQFRGFLMSALKEANNSTIETIRKVNNSPYGKDIQNLLGGEFRDLYPDYEE